MTPGKGTGLGLATSDQLVRRHGGKIHVDDRGGGGARFTVELPRRAAWPGHGSRIGS